MEGYRIFVTAACAAAAASAGLAPSCAKCCFWCGLGKMATRWQRHRPSQRWLLRRWLRWLCGGGCGSWWLRWWLRRGWLRRWLRWWPRLADAPPPRQGRHLVVTTGCKWSGSERLSVAVGKRGGEGSRHTRLRLAARCTGTVRAGARHRRCRCTGTAAPAVPRCTTVQAFGPHRRCRCRPPAYSCTLVHGAHLHRVYCAGPARSSPTPFRALHLMLTVSDCRTVVDSCCTG